MLDYESAPESIIIKNKDDLKNKLQQGWDDIKLNEGSVKGIFFSFITWRYIFII